jgi:DNA (cytosine-5)-methyltransferase 1
MGFPKSFKIPVSRTQMFRQMGNSVAVPVVRLVAFELVETLLSGRVIEKVAQSA